MSFINSLFAEFIKIKRSSALWVCLIFGGFVPTIMLIESLINGGSINDEGASWESVFNLSWVVMANFLLPMGVIIMTTLIVQLENKNNGWKQLNAAPKSYLTIYASKFLVIAIMTVELILLFIAMTILSCTIGTLVHDGQLPSQGIPFYKIFESGSQFFLACMPIMALQFGISLKLKNIILPMGIGLIGVIGSGIGLSWNYIQYVPYSYTLLMAQNNMDISVELYAFVSFIILFSAGYWLYRSKSDFS